MFIGNPVHYLRTYTRNMYHVEIFTISGLGGGGSIISKPRKTVFMPLATSLSLRILISACCIYFLFTFYGLTNQKSKYIHKVYHLIDLNLLSCEKFTQRIEQKQNFKYFTKNLFCFVNWC